MKRRVLATVVAATMFAPAGASAATVNVDAAGGAPVVTYRAAAGEVNAVKMVGTVSSTDLRMPFFEYGAKIDTGGGCVAGFPALCGPADKSFPIDVSLGDKSDVAYVNTFVSDATLNAGSGNDDVLAGGFSATADGDSGSDIVTVAASNAARGNGGAGNDRVTGGLRAIAAILTGGTGRDLLVPDGTQFDTAAGGSGADRLIAFTGRDVTLDGGAGPDLLVLAAGRPPIRRVLNGGTGSDVIVSHLGGTTVDGGADYDVIDVRGGADTSADTVTCGTGFDLVWADAGDTVASDCEFVLHSGAPSLPQVASAISAAQALIAHRPDPAGV